MEGEERQETTLVPYEEPIEGEYREVEEEPKEGFFGKLKGLFGREEEESVDREIGRLEKEVEEEEERRRKEREKLEERVEEKRGLEEEIASTRRRAELEELKAARRKFGRQYKRGPREAAKDVAAVAGIAYRIGTLGGPIKRTREELYLAKKPVRGLYVPTEMRRLTEPSKGMKGLTTPGEVREAPLQRATSPRLGKLQQLTSPRAGGSSPLARAMVPSRRLAVRPQGKLPLQSVQAPKPQINVLKKPNNNYYKRRLKQIKREL